MAGYGDKLFGLRELKLFNADGSGGLLLPRAMMLHVTPVIESARFEADGKLIGASSFLAGAEWELEAGGISLEVFAKLTGLSEVLAGSTPNRTLTLTQNAGAAFPYLRIYGRAVGDSGDIHCRLYRCKLTALEGTFRTKEFWVTYATGVAVSSASGVLEFVQRETGASL
jgi:hypothetical protein